MHSLTANKGKEILSIRIVLDRSGSMSGSQSITIEALNTYLTELKKEKGINLIDIPNKLRREY